MIVFKDYSVDRAGEMKHVSEYSSRRMANARDRRNAAPEPEIAEETDCNNSRKQAHENLSSHPVRRRRHPPVAAVARGDAQAAAAAGVRQDHAAGNRLRVAGWPELMAPLVVCGNEHRFLVAEQLREIGITPTASCSSRPAATPRRPWPRPRITCWRSIRKR
jgi:hypothetical protein